MENVQNKTQNVSKSEYVSEYLKDESAMCYMEEDKSDLPPKTKSEVIYSEVSTMIPVCFQFVRNMKIEVVMFLYMFAYIIRSVSSTTMIIDKVCLVHMGLSEEVCSNLKDYKETKMEIEKMANNYHLAHTLIQLLPSSLLACFIGPWSDRYGRKLPIIVALIGIILDDLGAVICGAILESRVEYYLLTAIPTGISGGFVGALTIVYSYASDITTPKTRTFKYAVMELAFGLAMPLGGLAGGWIFKYYGYVAVFATGLVGHLVGVLWVIFMLPETRGLDCKESLSVKMKRFFTFASMKESYRATMKIRPNQGRKQIFLLMLSACALILTLASTGSIAYLYTFHRYDWDNTTYSTVSAVFSVIGLLVTLIAIPVLTKVLKVGDPTLGIIGTISVLGRNIFFAAASHTWIYFVGNFFGMLTSLPTLAARSRISKLVSKDDLGKVFAFLSTAESMVPIIGSSLLALLFNASLDFFPGLVYTILVFFLLIPLGVFIWLALLPSVDYDELKDKPVVGVTASQGNVESQTAPQVNTVSQKTPQMNIMAPTVTQVNTVAPTVEKE